MSLQVISAGFLTTLQDAGRRGYERFGVPPSGAMDWFALRAANRLVNNPPEAAAIEFVLEPPVFQASEDSLVAATGCGYSLWVEGRQVGGWRAAWVRRGEMIYFEREDSAGWGYLAIAGGMAAQPVLGSQSTYLRGGLGGWHGRRLEEGDVIPTGVSPLEDLYSRAGAWLPPRFLPAYSHDMALPVILGPQQEFFSEAGLQTFLSSPYHISPTSDRMGYRLTGPRIEHQAGADLISEGMPLGSVQVPADGQPIVMLSDRPTSGGYPKIAVVARAGLPLLVQCPPGTGQIRFKAVSVAEAQAAYRAMVEGIEEGIVA